MTTFTLTKNAEVKDPKGTLAKVPLVLRGERDIDGRPAAAIIELPDDRPDTQAEGRANIEAALDKLEADSG